MNNNGGEKIDWRFRCSEINSHDSGCSDGGNVEKKNYNNGDNDEIYNERTIFGCDGNGGDDSDGAMVDIQW